MSTVNLTKIDAIGSIVTFYGKSTANSDIYIAQPGGAQLATGKALSDGNFIITSAPLPAGKYSALGTVLKGGVVANNNDWSTPIDFSVTLFLSENFDTEELTSSRQPIITDSGVLFWYNGSGIDQLPGIIKAKALRFMSTSFIPEAQLIGKLEGKVYILSPGSSYPVQPSGMLQILLPDAFSGLKKFSKVSFGCYSSFGGLTVKCCNGATEVASAITLPTGFKKVEFNSPIIDNIQISGYDLLAVDKIEFTLL
ncbi:hypothetical protein [Pseudomonas poae]|uniref:Uncharacterized protein n=1 Tax=Pseudomonas poae TaxID=200451 RepID=A0A2S9EL37_9PSED|nr:hypothetical protein [Pseudomonas poae]PRA32372.1 hypothetical protein CQZ97_06730 [Pseudomonas poae]PRC16115.1 hypothetical protein CQZ99_16720 [Pseudomonas poae]